MDQKCNFSKKCHFLTIFCSKTVWDVFHDLTNVKISRFEKGWYKELRQPIFWYFLNLHALGNPKLVTIFYPRVYEVYRRAYILLCCCWGLGIEPFIKFAIISADSWSNMIRHDQKLDQTRSDMIWNYCLRWTAITNFDQTAGRLNKQIMNKCSHVAWNSDIQSCVTLETVKLLAGKD
jgi:hypothetical protein